MKGKEVNKLPVIAEKLLIVDGFWGERFSFP